MLVNFWFPPVRSEDVDHHPFPSTITASSPLHLIVPSIHSTRRSLFVADDVFVVLLLLLLLTMIMFFL